jgi:PEP-CTERM motif
MNLPKIYTIALMLGLSASGFTTAALATTISAGEKLRVEFEFGSIPTTGAGIIDLLYVDAGGTSASRAPDNLIVDLYDGSTLLGTVDQFSSAWKFAATGSASSGGSSTADNVNLTSVADGTINGAIEITPIFNSPTGSDFFSAGSFTIKGAHGTNTSGFGPATPNATIVSEFVLASSQPSLKELLPGEKLRIDFFFNDTPETGNPGVFPVDLLRLDGGAVSASRTPDNLIVDLYDGGTLLGTVDQFASTWKFTAAGSAAAGGFSTADGINLSAVINGAIDGAFEITPIFNVPKGSDFFRATAPFEVLAAHGTSTSGFSPASPKALISTISTLSSGSAPRLIANGATETINNGETLNNTRAVTVAGALINNGNLNNNGGLFTVEPGGALNGTGNFTQNSGSTVVNGTFEQTIINILGGTADVNGPGATMTATDTINIGGPAVAELNVSNTGSVTATTINIDDGGILSGDGSIFGDVNVLAGGTLSAGNSPGTVIIETGNLEVKDGGTLLVEDGDFIDVKAGEVVIGDSAIIKLVFDLLPSKTLIIEDIFRTAKSKVKFLGLKKPATRIRAFVKKGTIGDVKFSIAGKTSKALATRLVTSVPEPGMLTIFLFGLVGLGLMRRRGR